MNKHVSPPNITIVFATRGRPSILKAALRAVELQTIRPNNIIISCVNETDIDDIDREKYRVHFGQPGLPIQRNAALNLMSPNEDFIVFFDDDFIAHERWIEETLAVFKSEPTIACITGTMLADGINGPGLTEQDAITIIKAYNSDSALIIENYSPYGCNMAYRTSSIAGLKFDERLVLYGWQEDRDFGGQVAKRGGRVVKISSAVGVHLGVKSGRVKGTKLGYSQIANPVYLSKKGTMKPLIALEHIICNVASNTVRSLHPEPYVDRFGRLKGNMIGFYDFLRGRLTPERATEL